MSKKKKKYSTSICTVCGVETCYVGNRPCDFCSQPKPEVGMGVTYGCWTDRHPGTIISVSKSGKSFTMQQDTAVRTDKGGMTECQSYEYKPNPEGEKKTFRLTARKGRKAWRSGVYTAGVGNRRAYHDFSF